MKKRIFVSSTFTDLTEYREAVRNRIRQMGAEDISMEDFGARDERPREECLRLINEESDVFVGIYSHRYGYIPKESKKSILEDEYDMATEKGLRRLIYVLSEDKEWLKKYIDTGVNEKKLQKFKALLREKHTCGIFSNKDELAAKVTADLARYFDLLALKRVDSGVANPSPTKSELKTLREWDDYRKAIKKNNRNVFLVHVLEPSIIEGQKFDCHIYLKRQGSKGLAEVSYAKFFFGKYWGNEVFHVENTGELIGVTTSAYGPFLCVCHVHFHDGYKVALERYIDFEMGNLFRQKGLTE